MFMKYKSSLSLLLIIVSLSLVNAQMNSENLTVEDTKKDTYKNLQIIPIAANKTYEKAYKEVEEYSNLKKAIKNKDIEIKDSGTVNTLIAKNNSKDPIYLIAGEIVKGGKQDRIVGEDIVIAPGEEKRIPAFCVEQGRWAEKKATGKDFNEYYNISSNSIRKAALVDKNQQKVWSGVANVTSKNNASSSTGTYAELEKSTSYTKDLNAYLAHFKKAFLNDKTIVGFIAVSGDKVIGCDIFATKSLFKNAYEGLLHSYITEAITNGSTPKLSKSEVKKYLDKFITDESKQERNLDGKGTVFKHKNKKLHLTAF